MLTKLIFLSIFTTTLFSQQPYKIVAIYFNELSFRVVIDDYDMKIKVRDCIPKIDKINTINWLIKKNLKTKKITIKNLKIRDKNILADFYLDKTQLSRILHKKGLCK
jgi:hypothetical protein